MTKTITRQSKIPATYMRGGTSKGLFFSLTDLPLCAQRTGPERDQLLLRAMGSPDPYEKQIDGMGGATSSTSKVALISKSDRGEHDIDYQFGQVSIDQNTIDWSGNCGNLTAAVGVFALENNLVDANRIPSHGHIIIRIWQVNIAKTIFVKVPIQDNAVKEIGEYELDGVAFPAPEIEVEFAEPVSATDALFPTGNIVDLIRVGDCYVEATMINAGIPTVFLSAQAIGLRGDELQHAVNSDTEKLALIESIRVQASIKMGLTGNEAEARSRQHTPKIAFIAHASDYDTASGKAVLGTDIALQVRAFSMGKMHHAMMGTAAVAIAAANAIPGTVVSKMALNASRDSICFGHPSGTLFVGAKAVESSGQWQIQTATMSRSARIIMEGVIRVPISVS